MTIETIARKMRDHQDQINSLKHQIDLLLKPSEFTDERVNTIVNAVEAQYDLKDGIVYATTQRQPIVEARMMCMFLIYYTTELGYNRVGRLFKKDHSTCHHAIVKIHELVETDKKTRNKLITSCHLIGIDKELTDSMIKNNVQWKSSATTPTHSLGAWTAAIPIICSDWNQTPDIEKGVTILKL